MGAKQQKRHPLVRYIVRADDGTAVREVGMGVSKLAEIAWARAYADKTGYKVWIIDKHDARRTVFRVEGKARRAAGGAR